MKFISITATCAFIGMLILTALTYPESSPELRTLSHNGIDRQFYIYVPDGYDEATASPLLLGFHGYTSTAENLMNYSKFNEIAERENFIVVYPQGTELEGKTHWNVGGWTTKSSVDDVSFVASLLDQLEGEFNIDDQRIYSTGMSNGGYMSFMLACQMDDRIAAVASVTGSMTPQVFATCSPERPVPVMQFHATTDQTVPYNGGENWSLPIEEVLEYWKGVNDTKADPAMDKLPDINTEDGSTVERYVYDHGKKGAPVIHYKVVNGGHDWFGAWGNKDIESSEIIWAFFSEQQLSGD